GDEGAALSGIDLLGHRAMVSHYDCIDTADRACYISLVMQNSRARTRHADAAVPPPRSPRTATGVRAAARRRRGEPGDHPRRPRRLAGDLVRGGGHGADRPTLRYGATG